MGNISSKLDDGSLIYLKDQSRFSVATLTINNGRRKVVLNITPNAYPANRYTAKRESGDDTPVSYIQDPETTSLSFIPRIDLEDELEFQFTFITRQHNNSPQPSSPVTAPTPVDVQINGLTFAFAQNAKELDTLVTREFHADPNLHKNSNVQLIGDYATNGNPSIEYSWNWRWRPPKSSEDRGGGWRNSCSFLEYDSRAHRLNTLASFSFWVHRNSPMQFLSPLASPNPDLIIPAIRNRIPSSQSYHSALSDTEGPTELVVPPSPIPQELEMNVPISTATTITPPPVIDVLCQRPGEDMSAVEDGPVFRATMKSLEQKTGNMRVQIKKVLKKAEAAQQAQSDCNLSMKAFLLAMQEASASNATAFKPALDHYFTKIAACILQYETENSAMLQKMIIDPISKLYNLDIKQAESKKKDFEDESRDYYAYVGRYLGQRQDTMKDKKRVESDTKYQNKRRNFELKRFDYSSFMQDLHGGRKEQELLSQLTRFADSQAKSFLSAAEKIENLKPQLDALVHEVAEADKEFKLQRTEREEKRRHLEKNATLPPDNEVITQVPTNVSNGTAVNGQSGYTSDTDLSRADSTSSQFGQRSNRTLSPSNSVLQAGSNGTLSTSPGAANKFKGIRDLEERDVGNTSIDKPTIQQRKEGLLWALSKPGSHIDPKGINKQAWHKFWIVLDQGKLSEYSNWKDKLDLHREPIDLRMASVRMARDAERRFCFEVITPQFKRVYQATTEDEMTNWINAINNALQSAFEGRSAPAPPTTRDEPAGREYGAALTGKTPSLSGLHGSQHKNDPIGVNRRITVGARPSYTRSNGNSYDESPTKLLEQIRNNDQGNTYCADCGSTSRVEWVSLNLGIVLCIECGGIHRSLGTHVSKIRSLTLDTQSFTTDIVEILLQVGNRISNMVWEAKLDPSVKPPANATRDQRLKFITAKYVDRAYVEPHSAMHSSVDDMLLTSVKKNDIQGVLSGIALRGNVNAHDRSRNTHVVFLALAAADPALPASPPASTISPKSAAGTSVKAFPIAELLIQNGAEIPVELPGFPLSKSAQLYVEQRTSRSTASTADTLGPLPIVNNKPSVAGDLASRLQKRGSAGARFAGKVTGLGER